MDKFNFNDKKHIHFIGIGGISMSGLAELMLQNGFKVSGSDSGKSGITENLERLGAKISVPQAAENITDDVDMVVYTAAIHENNPELMEVRRRSIPAYTRAEFLGAVMMDYSYSIAVAGTHGKTTTTGMISEIMLSTDKDPTISIGGMLPSIHGNFRCGSRDIFITEACEYTNSFLSLVPKTEIILNIDADHLDFFKDLDDIRNSFRKFAELIPEDGNLVINSDIPDLAQFTAGLKCNIFTYGLAPGADYYPENISYDENAHGEFDLCGKDGKVITHIKLSIPGLHNIGNSIAAFIAAQQVGADTGTIVEALKGFKGTERRFEAKGSFGGVQVIDDYAHHPTEIRATLTTAQKTPHNTLWCVFQPHTYSRTKALFNELAEALSIADRVVLADIYAARETDDLGVSSRLLSEKIEELGTKSYYLPSFEEIEKFLEENCMHGDLLITMGAGDVYKIGDALLSK